MKKTYIFLTLFLTFCFTVKAQTDDFSKSIVEYLKINGTLEEYNLVYDQTFELLKKQFKKVEVPEKVWLHLYENEKQNNIDELLHLLTFAYRKYYNKEEIAALTTYYSSDAAIQMRKDPANLTEQQSEEIASFFDSQLGKKTLEVKRDLTVDITKITSDWKRELFMKKMQKLIKMGYNNM